LIVNIPFVFARIQAWFLQMLPNPLLTVDQVKLLQHDNVVAPGARTLAGIGIEATAAEGVIESYLYAYRPQGQYTQLTENGGEA
jgi:NADH dehydrogenase